MAIDEADAVVGFYTLAATSFALDRLGPERMRRLPRYPTALAVLLGRLAVSTARQGQGLDGILVADALTRATSSDVLGHAMVVDAKDDAAARFFRASRLRTAARRSTPAHPRALTERS